MKDPRCLVGLHDYLPTSSTYAERGLLLACTRCWKRKVKDVPDEPYSNPDVRQGEGGWGGG